MRLLRWLLAAGLLSLVLAPAGALAFYKPSRVVVPEWFGLRCADDGICIDDEARRGEALILRDEAVAFVSGVLAPPRRVPRFVFCAGEACARSFGMVHAAAYNVATLGIVIRPKGWHSHFVRHELIHHVQNERLGTAVAFLARPEWWREGMAYALSDDPRTPIPSALLECWRAGFERWRKGRTRDALLSALVPYDNPADCKPGRPAPSS